MKNFQMFGAGITTKFKVVFYIIVLVYTDFGLMTEYDILSQGMFLLSNIIDDKIHASTKLTLL